MISWNNYIKKLIAFPDDMDSITLSFDGGISEMPIPAIVKATILMLDKMVLNQGKKHIIVFPEREYTTLTFAVIRAIHNISTGKIETEYNIKEFKRGDRLKLRNAVVEFLGLDVISDIDYIQIRLSDINNYSIPVSSLPIFQKTDTKRPLSSSFKFNKEREALNISKEYADKTGGYLDNLKQFKSHMSSSVFYVSTVNGVIEQLADMRFCGDKLRNYLLLGKTNYEGNISNIGAGQLAGIPAIVFASDLYAVNAAIDNGNPAQSIIIDISNMNLIYSQLDALDEAVNRNIPIIFVTDTANSLDISTLKDRGFNVWRWDKSTITDNFYKSKRLGPETIIEHCAKHKVKYVKIQGNEISESARILAKYRWKNREQSAQMMDLYGELNNISFSALRGIVPSSEYECEIINQKLNACFSLLEHEKQYISQEEYDDYSFVICNYRSVYSTQYRFKKVDALKEAIESNQGRNICLVIQEHGDKFKIEQYWRQELPVNTKLEVLYPSEYYAVSGEKYEVTIVVGWLKRVIMRKLIYSFHTISYLVFLYDYENRWKNHDVKQWRAVLNESDNKKAIETSFKSSDIDVSFVKYHEELESFSNEDIAEDDELEEIDITLRENKVKRYVKSGVKTGNQIVDAIPVSFVGGYISFYQTGHEVISATKLIMKESDRIESLMPEKLRNGDFIVVLESDKNIVREMADIILIENGQGDLRDLAMKWKESIEIELLFISIKQFYDSLIAVGFKKGFPTVKRWVENDNVIAPRDLEDLEYVAKVTQSQVLLEKIDEIYEAARIVRAAHIQAGKILSENLKLQIAEELKRFGKIDPFNIWEPIDLEVEGIGLIHILKIIDIGTIVQVDTSDTNRLIEG